MLRITAAMQTSQILLILEGRLAGDWVEELRKVTASCRSQVDSCLTINLTAVSGMDSAGRDLLIELYASGVDLEGCGLGAKACIEEIAGNEIEGRRLKQ